MSIFFRFPPPSLRARGGNRDRIYTVRIFGIFLSNIVVGVKRRGGVRSLDVFGAGIVM